MELLLAFDENGAGCNRRAGTTHVPSGSAISHGNSESHRTSKAVWQRSRKAELSDTMAVVWASPFCHDLHMLLCLGTFNICTTWDIGWMDIFLWIIYAFSQEYCFQASPGKSWAYYPSRFYLAYLKVLLCPGGCDSNKDSRDLLMRLWLQDILGTSAPVLTQEQDNQTKSKQDSVG